MKASTLHKLESFALAACLFASAANLKAQTNTNLPSVSILATDPYALEGTSDGAFTLIRQGSTSNALTVGLNFYGTGSNGVDYALVNSPITIPTGYLAVDILIHPLVVNTGNKTVTAVLETNAGYTLSWWRKSATVNIIDDTFNDPPPSVTIISPTNGSTFTAPATFTLTAMASDPAFAITSVSFYEEFFFLGRVTNSPYSLTVSNARPGKFNIFARAVDAGGQSAISAPVDITVTCSNTTTGSNGPIGGTAVRR